MAQTTKTGNQWEKAKDVAGDVTEKAKDAASSVAQAAGSAASAVGQKADDLTSSAGAGIKNLAGTVRDQGPQKGMLGQATHAVADTLEKGGKYLEQEGLSGLADDVTQMIKRNPVPAILIGIGVGYLIACALRRN